MSLLRLMHWKIVVREPLFHFLLIGGAIFGFYAAVSDAPVSESENQIVVTASDIERLRGIWERQWQRPPTAAKRCSSPVATEP